MATNPYTVAPPPRPTVPAVPATPMVGGNDTAGIGIGGPAPSSSKPFQNMTDIMGSKGVPSSFGQPGNGNATAHPASPAPFDAETSGDADVSNFKKQADDLSKQLAAGGYDPKVAADFYREADAPIQQAFYQQADQTAQYLARQGLGASQGINLAAGSQLTGNKAALESQAGLKAQDLARELQRRSLLDAFSTQAMKMSDILQNKGIDVSSTIARLQLQAQLEMFREQMDAQSNAGIGNLIGTIGGAAIMGAMA